MRRLTFSGVLFVCRWRRRAFHVERYQERQLDQGVKPSDAQAGIPAVLLHTGAFFEIQIKRLSTFHVEHGESIALCE